MKRMYKSFCMSALALLISSVGFVSAQINYSQNWDTGDLNTWTTSGGGGTYSRNTTTPCAGAASVRANVYTSSPTFLISPALGGNTGGDLTVNFSYKWTTWSGNNAATGTQIDYIKVQWAATATGPFVDALVLPGSSHVTSSSCVDASTTITGLPEGNIFIRFETKAASGADLYCYIDNVVITQGPGPYCPAPLSITSSDPTTSSLNLSWTTVGSETLWNVQWGNPGFTPGTGNEIGSVGATGTPSVSIGSLSSGTSYHFYVQSDCGSGNLSTWAGPFLGTTLEVPTPAPYYDDFTTSQWMFVGTGTNKWCIGSGTGNTGNSLYVSSNGSTYAYNTGSATTASHAYKTVSVPAGPVGSYKIRFDWKGVAEGTWDFTRVWLVPATSNITPNTLITTGNTTGAVQLVASLVGGTNWANVSYNVPAAFLGTTFKVVFEWKNDPSGGGTPTAIDNFAVYSDVPSPAITQSAATPTCTTGTELSVSEVANSPVVFYWQTTATGTSTTDNASTPWTVFENGTYYVRAYNSFLNEWAAASQIVVSNIPSIAAPPAPIAAANPACLPGTEIVMASATPTGVEYYWQGTSNITSTQDSPASVPYSVTSSGTYYVKAYESVTGCWSIPVGVNVTVDTFIPEAPTAVTNEHYLCIGATTNPINATVASNGTEVVTIATNYNWIPASNTINSNLTLPVGATVTSATISFNNLTSSGATWFSDFNFTLTGAVTQPNTTLGGSTTPNNSTVSFPVTVNGSGAFSIALNNTWTSNPTTTGSIVLTVIYTLPATSVAWYDSSTNGNLLGSGSTLESVGSSVLSNPATQGVYEFYAASLTGACESATRTLVTVTVDAVNVQLIAGSVSCNNGNDGSFTLGTISCGVEPLTYSVDGGAFGAIPTDLTVGDHTVVVKDANGDESATYTITIGDAPAPYDVTEIATTNNQSTISWTAPGSETQWNVVWGPLGFTPGDADQIGSATANDTVFIVTGLVGNTEYDIYVSADCGAGTVTGDWSSVEIWTECDGYSLPFHETFELETSATISCWISDNQGAGSWYIGVGSADFGPVTTAFEGTQNAYYNGGSSGRLVSPVMMVGDLDSVAVVFAISQANWGGDQNTTTLAMRNGTSGAWTEVKTYLNDIPQWMVDTVVINTTAMDSLQISFLAVDEVGYNNTIDDLIIEACYVAPTADGSITVCRSEGSIDLSTVTTPMASGIWNGGSFNSFVNGSNFNISNLVEGTYVIKHIAKTACASDTAEVTVTVTAPLSAGIDGTLNVCKNQPIGLFTGLSGNVDYGGTWYTAAGVALTGSTFTTGTLQGQQVYTYVVSNGICDADTAQVIVNIGSCNFVGVEDLDLFDNITISPNPSTGLFNIEGVNSPNFTYEVIDLNGRVIKGETKINSSTTSVNLSEVETGVYMIRLKGEGSEKMIRLIKQ